MHDWLRPPANRLAGRLPGVGINAEGRREAERVARRLDSVPVDWVVSSPLQRTMETAHIIAHHRGLSVQQDERFVESGFGPWEGMRIEDIEARYPEEWRTWREHPQVFRLPGAETLDQIAGRMHVGLKDWLDRGGHIVIVSHQDPLAALLCRVIGMPLAQMRKLEIRTGSISIVRRLPGGDTVEAVNSGVVLPSSN